MTTQSQAEIDSLTGATEHLSYIEQVLAENALGKDVRGKLLERIAAVRDRLNDSNLYMAIAGGASTGKSTFINALLKEQLLEARTLTMTTTVSSVIKYGPALSLEVCFYPTPDRTGRPINRKLSVIHEPITLSDLPSIQALSLRELIVALTTSDKVAQQLVSLTVIHPAAFLESGICIVDTPGADAINEAHLQATQAAIAHADAAIIITPARQIVSEALLKMITRDLQLLPLLHRCLFLITSMDLIRERERERLIRSARQRLERGLTMAENQVMPPILTVSAQAVVDGFSQEVPIVEDSAARAYWQSQFEDLEAALFSRLKRQRVIAISERVLRLLTDLFIAMEINLAGKWERHREERTALEDAVILDLETFALQQHQDCQERMAEILNKALVWVDFAVARRRDCLIEEVEKQIDNATSLGDLKKYMNDDLTASLTHSQEKLQEKVLEQFEVMAQAAQLMNQIFDQRFSKAYQRLSVLQQADVGTEGVMQVTLGARNLIDTASGSEALVDTKLNQRVKGAAIAMIVSAFALSGLWLLIPTVVGSLFGGLLGPSLDMRKAKLLEELRPKLLSQFSKVESTVSQATKTYSQELQHAINQHIDKHVRQYAEMVHTMRSEQQTELDRLSQRQETIEQHQKDLTRRRGRIHAQMKALNAIAV